MCTHAAKTGVKVRNVCGVTWQLSWSESELESRRMSTVTLNVSCERSLVGVNMLTNSKHSTLSAKIFFVFVPCPNSIDEDEMQEELIYNSNVFMPEVTGSSIFPN